MLALDVLKHYLLSRRTGSLVRTIAWVSVVGIAIGIAALIIVTSVMNGFNRNYQRRLFKVEPHLVVPIAADQLKIGDNTLAEQVRSGLRARHLDKELADIWEFETQDVILRTLDGAFGGAIAKGLDGDGMHRALNRVSDSSWNLESTQLGDHEIIMGAELARSLGVFEGDQVFVIPPEALAAGSSSAPQFEKATVKALLTTKIGDIDQKLVWYQRGKTFVTLQNTASREGGLEIFIEHPEDPRDFQNELQSLGFKSETWIERNAVLFFALKVEKVAMTTFLSLSALITGFSIVSVLVLLLHQKRKDLGILMAMGLTRRQTQMTFACMGLVLSLVGLFAGLIIGVTICLVLERYPLEVLPDIYYDSTIPAELNWITVFTITVFGIFLSAMAAWLPARHTVQLSPADALRK